MLFHVLHEKVIQLSGSCVEIEIEVKNADGLHMRPAMQFVDVAAGFTSSIQVSNGDMSVDAKSIMQMTMLAATQGTILKVCAQGDDARDAVNALRKLVEEDMLKEATETTRDS